MQNSTTMSLVCPTLPNQGGSFQAILNQARAGNDEIARSEAAMNQWCGQSTFNMNQPF